MTDLFSLIDTEIKTSFQKTRPALSDIKPLQLAYLGDTVFDLYIRSRLVGGTTLAPGMMHKKATGYVNAASQAKMMQLILDDVTEEESDVFRHARNHRSLTVPKNMSPVDYKWATGFEALLGYLYLNGKEERLYTLMHLAVTRLDEYLVENPLSTKAKRKNNHE